MCKFPRAPPCPFCRAASAVSNLTREACDRAAHGWLKLYHPRLAAYSRLDQGSFLLSWWHLVWEGARWELGTILSLVFFLWTTWVPSFVSTSKQNQLWNYEQVGGPTGMESASTDCWAPEGWKRLVSALVCISVPVQNQKKIFFPELAQRIFRRYPNFPTNLQTGLWGFQLTLYSCST